VLSAVLPADRWPGGLQPALYLKVALLAVIVGGIVTAWRRLARIAALLREKAH
jgi:hypothetical protein